MSAPLTISNHDARALILLRSTLSGEKLEAGSATLTPLIRKLGYVQLDSIKIVERAQHHILYARHLSYRPRQLVTLQAKSPSLFEHWTHDASLIPLEHYPHWHHRFSRNKTRLASWRADFGSNAVLRTVRDHIADHGPSLARDFAHLGGRTGPWWGWGPAKAALEFLWRTGVLAVLHRDGFEKIYDLSERAIPQSLREARPSKSETFDWACNEGLARLGAATPKMLSDFWRHLSIEETKTWISREKRAGRLIDVYLQGSKDKPGFVAVARPQIEADIESLPEATSRLRALSPFDPVLRDRSRVDRIFNFDYRIEVYTPGHKRKYGYYVFPLLENDRFVGRIDMKAERDKDRLVVKGLWLERGFSLTAARRQKLERELVRQARLGAVRDIIFPTEALKTS